MAERTEIPFTVKILGCSRTVVLDGHPESTPAKGVRFDAAFAKVLCPLAIHINFVFVGHRFRPMYDFGFVALDILYTYPEDTGVYMCKATNKYGSDVNQVQLRCLGL